MPEATRFELMTVFTRGCTSTRIRSLGSVHGVVAPVCAASSGTVSWYTYHPGLASVAACVV